MNLKTLIPSLIIFVGIYILYIFLTLPSIENINSCFITSINKVDLCPSNNSYVKLEQVSENLQSAVLIAEDAGFYSHSGVDFHEIKESFLTNLKRKKFSRGGSTITQQLVKNLYLSTDKTINRKARELFLSFMVESSLEKSQILEKYLNVVELGPNIFGVKAASLFYFSKTPTHLSVVEAAYIAHLLPSPITYSETLREKRSLSEFNTERISDIINKLYYYKKIDEGQHLEAFSQLESFISQNDLTD